MDAVQCHGADLNLLPVLRPRHCVDHWLLAVLRQLHHQPGVLCAVQRHVQEDIQEPAAVPV